MIRSKKLDTELARYKEQIKKTRPGPAQEAVKARAMRVLKQKRMYEGQRDMLYNQTFNLDQVAFAAEGIKDAQQTIHCASSSVVITGLHHIHHKIIVFLGSAPRGMVQGMSSGAFSIPLLEPAYLPHERFSHAPCYFSILDLKVIDALMSALKSANKELKGMMKTVKIQDIDNLQDEMMDLMDVSNEIQESLGRSYSVPDDVDEEELMGELDALESDMGLETEDGVPAYLQPDKEPDLDAELNLPSAPTGHAAVPAGRAGTQAEDEWGLPAVPRASLRG
ncbi:SNF7 family protein [Actinidia rufa]|uniref:SNF7 family protein n=1 Tax=Actinidia rufa TaxID=165716 RepID=A0A7J0DBA6_9ERIC|nr:SNF7 family protein [Actinidia rufa]